jgi:hypothetical protein
MALEVEDGTAKANAESYISVADTDSYHSLRGNTAWTGAEGVKEAALRKATDYMLQVYRLRWRGTRVTGTQSLDWPRNWVERDDYAYVTMNGAATIGGFQYYPADEVPVEVQRACAELALKALSDELSPDIGRRTIREKVDVIEVEYDKNSPQYVMYRAIDNILAPFLSGLGSGAFRKVVRT